MLKVGQIWYDANDNTYNQIREFINGGVRFFYSSFIEDIHNGTAIAGALSEPTVRACIANGTFKLYSNKIVKSLMEAIDAQNL